MLQNLKNLKRKKNRPLFNEFLDFSPGIEKSYIKVVVVFRVRGEKLTES